MEDEVLQAEKINDLEFDAELLINQGKKEMSIKILHLIIKQFDNLNDLVQPAVNFAKEKRNNLHNI